MVVYVLKKTNMRSNWKVLSAISLILMTLCAKPKPEWLKWQESLDLANPNALSFKIDMQKKVYYEGEPMVFKILIINKVGTPQTIVHTGSRTSQISGGLHSFEVVSEFDSVFLYCPYVHANIGMSPNDAIVFGPYDTLYTHAILYPDLFRQRDYPKRKLQPGVYILESSIHLGTKFYPKPGRALNITSHPTMFTIDTLPAIELDNLSKMRPYMEVFFGSVEEGFWSVDYNSKNFIDSALFWLDTVKHSESRFAPYADFIYTCIPALTRRQDDREVKINKSVVNAKSFIEKYPGSTLAEEMEFNIAWWLYYKDSTSVEFLNQAMKVIEQYPKNLNSCGIKKLLNR